MLDRKSWLLTFLAQPSGPFPVDQIRVMKGMFLWSQEGPPEARQLFHFEPYDFGPFDGTIYRELESLEKAGMIAVDVVVGTRQRCYRLTQSGESQAKEIEQRVPSSVVEQLSEIKALVTGLGFAALLKHVYDKYPDYAVRSVARV